MSYRELKAIRTSPVVRAVVALAVVVVCGFVVSSTRGFLDWREKEAAIRAEQANLKRIEREIAEIKQWLEDMKHDQARQVEEIRKRYPAVGKDEILYALPNLPPAAASEP